MSDLMRAIPFDKMVEWIFSEYEKKGSVFGIRKDKFYKNTSPNHVVMFGEKLGSPLGPAAGPNSQLSQNIVASYLAGCRFIELKTVQKMDGEELRKCVAKPCINAEDECYNVEWSTELTVEEALIEYIKAWFALYVVAKEFDLSDKRDFAFNMSIGYDLEGIKSYKINNFIDSLKDASKTEIWKECSEYLINNISNFKNLKKEDVENISTSVCSSITLSTLHGCPPDEIERISNYLLEEKKLHTYIKCNPTLLGYEFARNILDEMGYDYLSFDDHHFNDDLQYKDAIPMITRLIEAAKNKGLNFGVKLTNTFPVRIERKELPGEEMYMSGRSLYPLTISLANKLTKEFKGSLPISFSGGLDFFNVAEVAQTGIFPITFATTILKPGGYERIYQLANAVEPYLKGEFNGIDLDLLDKLAKEVITNKYHIKAARAYDSRKTKSKLNLFECFKAPCKDGGCPIEQQIPEYLKLVSEKKYDEAFNLIAVDNTAPSITGTICDHKCQSKCTRLDYDSSLEIRNIKKLAANNAQDKYISNIKQASIKTDKKAVVIGAGPAGIACATFLRRNGVDVTVLEKREKPYGIVNYVIPEFRISKELIQRDFELAEKAGVNFKFSVPEQYNISELKKEYDYVVLATGAWKEGASPVKEGQDKLIDALKFLEESKVNNCEISLGKRVAIIGGGDVAMDCARAAKKASCVDESIIVYRRTKEFMPAEHEEIDLALNDGVKFMELLSPVSYDGNILKCEIMELSDIDDSGRRSVKGSGEYKELQFDTVIGAVGARVDNTFFSENGLELNNKGYVETNENNETSLSGVYLAGDCKAGASTIVKAIADGKTIATDILSKLQLSNDFIKSTVEQDGNVLYYRKGLLSDACKTEEEGYRCLTCDQLCEICCDVCPNRANVEIEVPNPSFNNKHQILHLDGMCNECGNCGVFCPHNGNPYKDKITLFWTEEDFCDSTNKGFLKTGENKFKVRKEDGSVINHELGDGKISDEMNSVLNVIINNYSFYNFNL